MATRQTASLARLMRAPAIILLLIWMIVPLGMTLYYSFLNYNLLDADEQRVDRALRDVGEPLVAQPCGDLVAVGRA